MEILILLAIGLFVWVSMKRGDRIAIQQGTDIKATPQWVMVVFFVVVTGLLFACLGPAILAGLAGGM